MAKHVAFTGAGRLSHARQALTDLDVQVLIRPDDWTPAAEQFVVGEYNTTGNLRGWALTVNTDGTLRLRWSDNGTNALFAASTVATGLADGTKTWLRAVLDVNNGAAGRTARFYTSDDGTVWTQLGADVTTAGVTSIFSSASNVITMGGQATAASFTGKVYAVRLYSAIDGTTNLVDPDPWDWSSATYGATGVSTVTPAVTATAQDSWPPRVVIAGTNLENDDSVTFYRSYAGDRTAVRGAEAVVPNDPSLVRVDGEQPFGVPLTYVMEVNEDAEYNTTPLTVDLTGGNVALSDAITGQAAEVIITAWPEKRHERPASRFVVGGRNVVVSGLRPGFSGSVEVLTESDSARENLSTLLDEATSGVVQLRQGGDYPGVDSYVSVLSDVETRWSQDGTDPRRVWTLEVVEVEAWASSLEAAGYTYQDVADVYTGLTYNNVASDYATYLALAQGDFE